MTRDRLIEETDKHIMELVIPKVRIKKAYNYLNCVIDTEQFRYLEENYGIGNPTSVVFVPLIKKHIDGLIGEHLEIPLTPTISCKDSRTLNNIMRDRQLRVKAAVVDYYKNQFRRDVLLGITGKLNDEMMVNELRKVIQDTNNNYVSDYEISAQNIIKWILQSRSIDIYNKRRMLLQDVLTAGQCYYRSALTPDGHNITLETFDPMNVFPDKNPDSNYVKDSSRIVIRKWMTRQDVLNKYGKYLNGTTIKELNDIWRDGSAYSNTVLVRANVSDGQPIPVSQHIGDDINVTPGLPEEGNHRVNYFIPVYEVEWIETEKELGQYVKNRYRTVRIGETIYITFGKDETAIRTIDDPTDCKLSVNGIFFVNRSNKPFSLVLQCADLQDKYNIVHYLRDNVVANSGTIGDFVDLAKLPACLGSDWAERLEKLTAYKKNGMFLFDSSQDGTPVANTFVNGYDDTIKANTIQAFEMIIQSLERQCSSITGMYQQRLDGIQQYDAVRNVQAGARNSYIVTKWIYQQMDSLDRDMLIDMIDEAKIAYKDGIQGEIILGPNLKATFTALPRYYTMTDFDVHLPSSTQMLQDIETLRGAVNEFIKAGNYEPDIIMEAMTATSVTEMKANMNKAYQEKKREENILGQMQQKIEELGKQLQQSQSELQKANNKIEQLNESKIRLEQQKMQMDIELGFYKAKADKAYKEGLVDIKKEQLKVEINQLHDGNPYNDIIKNV